MAHGRYTIVGKLADGGMAEIFLATQHGAEGFEKPVVLKRVLTAFSADPQFRNMFIDEAHISMTLAHGNIVQVLDVGLSGERTFLVLELVEGWDLEDVLARAQATGPDHPWPPSLGLYVTAQICRGLAYAHAKQAPDGRPLGIVHRDVNPTNVLVSEQGEVKLADFGIAKAERKREQTAAGVIKGKIGFMSPEQATGKTLDARSDLFSVGTMMYLMLTGRRPFDAPSELESMLRSQRAEYQPPEELNPHLSPEATAIVNRAMHRDPAARYQTADQMLIDVERVLRGQYNSAGQTELKVWLAELARRDGALPMGRRAIAARAVPAQADPSSSDLSAGVSVELSDVGVGNDAATVVSLAAPVDMMMDAARSRGPGGVPALPPPSLSPPPRLSPSPLLPSPSLPSPQVSSPSIPSAPLPSSTPAHRSSTPAVPTPAPQAASPAPRQVPSAPFPSASSADAPFQVAAPSQAVASSSSPARVPPEALLPGRLTRKSRVGLGFFLGAICMLGAVYGIKWLAAWAGREGIVIPHVIGGRGDAADRRDPVAAARPDERAPAAADDERAAPPSRALSNRSSEAQGDAGFVPSGGADRRSPDAAASSAIAAREPAAGAGPSLPPGPSGSTAAIVAPTDASAARVGANGGPDAAAARVAVPEVVARAPDDLARENEPTVGEDEDEETLLGRVIPDAGAIIGEDEADEPPRPPPPPPPPHHKEAQAQPRGQTPARRAAPQPAPRPPPTPVLIRITSSPLGAVVRTKKQVLGRTPIAIRFNSGNTYQLTFVKAGYVTSHRMLAVASGKPRSVSVPMKKAAAPTRRSGLFRGR